MKMNKTKIEWCDSTWNPVTGCLHGCEYCYARKIANRFGKVDPLVKDEFKKIEKAQCFVKPDNPYPYLFKPTYHRYRLEEPSKKTKGQNIFVCSMADLFGNWVSQEWINEIFTACNDAQQHNYLFLTKNVNGYEKAVDNFAVEDRGSEDSQKFFKNFWFGVTITNQNDVHKATILQELPEGHRFLSIEPLHEQIELNISLDRCPVCGSNEIYEDNPYTAVGLPKYYCDCCGEWESNNWKDLKASIDWVILGAETGNRKGKIIPKEQWILSIVEQCRQANIPVFMKDSLVSIMGEANMLREFPEELKR